MTTEQTKALRALAEAATPGPWAAKRWHNDEAEIYGWNITVNGYLLPLCDMETDKPEECDANAAWIAAANPAAILELLDHTAAIEAERDALRAELDAIRAMEPVASIYITPDGQREVDDWEVPLPNGRNTLYTLPAQKDRT